MANTLDSNKVYNFLNNANTYYKAKKYFKATHQLLGLGNKVSSATTTCETLSEWIFDEVETMAEDFSSVLSHVCEY
jgi:hypothetical protein